MKKLLLSLLLVTIFAVLGVPAYGQLQQSGGAGSTITTLTLGGNAVTALATGELNQNVARINGVVPLMGNGVTGTGSLRVTIASDNTAFSTNATLQTGSNVVGKFGIDQTTPGTTNLVSIGTNGTVAINTALPAGTNLIGTVAPKTTCGTTFVDSGFVSVPNASTVVTNMSAPTCVTRLFVSNVTGSAATFALSDNAGTPNVYITGFSVPANSNMVYDLGGMKFTLGVKWTAGTASALIGQLVGYQ